MRFPHYQQLDSMDCGPTCLQIIADFYGKHFSLSDLRERCYITREGVSLLGISEAAQTMGFRCIGVKLSWNQFLEYANMPCIVQFHKAIHQKNMGKLLMLISSDLCMQWEIQYSVYVHIV